jgi:hypothetical protein
VSTPYTLNTRPPYAAAWSKSLHESLAVALLYAWRKRRKDCSVGDITRGGRVVVGSELVSQLLDEMDEVMRAEPTSRPPEVAEEIARRIDEAGNEDPGQIVA